MVLTEFNLPKNCDLAVINSRLKTFSKRYIRLIFLDKQKNKDLLSRLQKLSLYINNNITDYLVNIPIIITTIIDNISILDNKLILNNEIYNRYKKRDLLYNKKLDF